jgi:hypothetical protein
MRAPRLRSIVRPGASAWLLAALAGGCGGGAAAPTGDAAVDQGMTVTDSAPVSTQIPPQGQKALEAWLAAGHYKMWTCEKAISDPRPDPMNPTILGAHGRHRICSNDALLASTSGPYPAGAASVKELFDKTDEPYGFAVGVKVSAGTDMDSWYWYERIGRLASLSPVADGVGNKTCGADCHAAATRDNVFIRAQ